MLNHKSFIEKANNILSSNIKAGHCFLFYTDIVEFQLINRYYGIEKGDSLLYAIETLLGSIPEIAVFERVISDQFVFLAISPEETTDEQIKAAANRHLRVFLTEQKDNYPDCNLRISCGIYSMTNSNFVDAIDGANMARKEAKRRGSASAVVFDHVILDEISNYHREEQKTNLALQEKRFVFFLQPKVDLLTGEIIGAEALARRMDEDGNIIFPDKFLEIMEANGSIVELDALICEQVCKYIADRLEKGLPVVRTSVNLSRLHIQDTETAKRLHATAEKYAVPPDLLEFELTETILLHEFEGAKNLIDQLRGYQYHVSIDDFGAGYAGINIWQELNFDTLKLDKRFLSDEEPVKSRNTAIVPNVINIAQRLGIDVICEGVETEEQCEYLLRLGCTAVQGFFFSRPIPKDEFYSIYQKQRGYYQLSFRNRDTAQRESKVNGAKTDKPKAIHHIVLAACCSLFLAACVVLTLGLHRNIVTNMFVTSIENNLDSYAARQAAMVKAKINGITTTMNAFSILIAQRNNTEFIDTYISALSENNPEVTFLFSTAEELETQISQGNARQLDIEYVERLKNGETVISDIVFSKLAGNRYCFSIGVPVFINGEFAGGLRAIVYADLLTAMDQYISPYGEVEAALVLNESGSVLLSSGGYDIQFGANIFEDSRFSNDTISGLQKALSSADNIQSFRVGEATGTPYYVSVADLSYNGWKAVIFFRAEEADAIIASLLQHTVASAGILMLAILFVCLIVSIFFHRWRQKANADTERYLLLEQFSDTVLFDYDCRKDIIRFTPNAVQLFRVQKWTHQGFLAHLASAQNIYPADHMTVKEVMTGRGQNEKSEIRIRIKHPSDERYYWCLVQYKYIYDGQKLVSIIGKIMDIDSQQKRENQLVFQAVRDGLTNLYNRSATQDLIGQCMQEDKYGLLFMIDVDDFKQINDTFGHPQGDRALQLVSECLKIAFRSNDIIGRMGGDELLVYMRGVNDYKLIHKKMETLWRLLCGYSKERDFHLTISVGVARFPDNGQCFEDLFKRADQAMYEAKQNGKQQYCLEHKCYTFETITKQTL